MSRIYLATGVTLAGFEQGTVLQMRYGSQGFEGIPPRGRSRARRRCPGRPPMRKSELTTAQRRLVEMMQEINFGCIRDLVVRDGQPVFEPPPHKVREYKFCCENDPRPEAVKVDFALKAAVRELFARLEALGNGVVLCLQVQRGLPFRMTVEEVCA